MQILQLLESSGDSQDYYSVYAIVIQKYHSGMIWHLVTLHVTLIVYFRHQPT